MAIENGTFIVKAENQKKSASISTSPSTNAKITANIINATLQKMQNFRYHCRITVRFPRLW